MKYQRSSMFDRILERYLTSLATTGKAPATQRAIHSDLAQFCTWWEHSHQRPFDLTQIVERDLRAWKTVRQQEEGVAPATINRGLSTLCRLCAWAMEQRLLTENPVKEIDDIPATPVSPRGLSDLAVDALLRATRAEPDLRLRLRDEALLALLVYAGVRIQEACFNCVTWTWRQAPLWCAAERVGKHVVCLCILRHNVSSPAISRRSAVQKGCLPLGANRSGHRCSWGCSVRSPGVRWFQGSKHERHANV